MKILVTGAAGFIGFHLSQKLLKRGDVVVGIDSINDYYDPILKEKRVSLLKELAAQEQSEKFQFFKLNLADNVSLEKIFKEQHFDRVIHLAAQAGVRYSLENPHAYVESNIVAFTNILENCRYSKVSHLTYASTSSVYGGHTNMPFTEHESVDHPLQFYAATKKANELMAHSYSHLFKLPTTGLRFFTVYGPWGRPDMALFLFTKNILEGKPIKVFNGGNHTRDFTYIEDIVDGIIKASDRIASPNPNWNPKKPDPATSNAPYRIYNIGNNNPIKLSEYIEEIEQCLNKKAIKELLPLQPGDVPDTFADVSDLESELGFKPSISVKQGIRNFVNWYLEYYGIKN
ncbi:NAD-dependent epimerase [Leptospira yasudae]|uniref:Capsular biosynthesis protein CpsI n=1 Tax=Leptospira yasudae TaxID=2202201 RepID=A0ABX9LZB6_9LEPT|nr:NAD-dependent epimerase [Leptospira yasudae]RHX78294.1 capsular biosynthesis protein CpsI [Leptospira yasudae]